MAKRPHRADDSWHREPRREARSERLWPVLCLGYGTTPIGIEAMSFEVIRSVRP